MREVIRWLVFGPMFVLMVSGLIIFSPLMAFFAWLDRSTFGWSDITEMSGDLAKEMKLFEAPL